MRDTPRRLITLALFVGSIMQSHQSAGQVPRVGQKIPDIVLTHVLRWKEPTIHLSHFKGKFILLDFWKHSCIACIRDFGKLETLQREFGDNIQIVLVNQESEDSTIRFFSKRRGFSLPNLPMVTQDSVLSELFPASSYPYLIWIDTTGIIRQFTESDNASSDHIQAFLKGNDNVLQARPYQKKRYGSLFEQIDTNWQKKMMFYAYLSKCNRAVYIGNHKPTVINEGNSVRLSQNCSSLLQLFKRAFEENGKYDFNVKATVITKNIDTGILFPPENKLQAKAWEEENLFNYELMVPTFQMGNMYKLMQQDLMRMFHIEASVEVNWVSSYTLVRTNSGDRLRTKGGKPMNKLWQTEEDPVKWDSLISVNNQPISSVTEFLKTWIEAYFGPFYDGTGYLGQIDLSIRQQSLNQQSLNDLRNDLLPYGLTIIEQEKPRPVLVLVSKLE